MMDLSPEERALIEAKRAEAATLEAARTYPIRKASDYTPDEKCAAFDKLHELALSIWEQTKSDRFRDEDSDHWCGEAVLELLAQPDDLKHPGGHALNRQPFWGAFCDLFD